MPDLTCISWTTDTCRMIIIITDKLSGVHKLTALYNILQHVPSFTNIIHIIMTTNNV